MDRLFYLLLFSGLCPITQSVSREYVLIQQQKTWDEAQVYCRQNYIDLATVQTNEDWINLQTAVKPAATLVWTGLYNDINSWRWSYKDENTTFLSFYTEDPNNSNGKQECVASYYSNWNDLDCGFEYYFFCFDETQTGSNRYVLITDAWRTWRDAQTYCRQFYTDLATIRSQTENDLINVATPDNDYAWIGLFRDSWKWSDGTNVSTYPINWMNYEPDMVGMDRPCGAAEFDGTINDQLCSSLLPFVCMQNSLPNVTQCTECTESKKHIVRVEVKTGQILDVPVVMEAILQLIKQKLTVQGMENNTTLTWRLQPDGNVFSQKPEETNHMQRGCNTYL